MQHCHGKKPNEELEKQYRSESQIYVQCKCFSIKWSKIGADAALPTEKRPTAEVKTNSTGQAKNPGYDPPPDLFQITFTRTAGQTFL